MAMTQDTKIKEVGHTAGPWLAIADPLHFDCKTDVADAGGGLVAGMCGVNPKRDLREMEANARLIAAAPDMLAELYAQLDGLEDDIRWADGGEMERLMTRRDAVRTVISKAEGRAS